MRPSITTPTRIATEIVSLWNSVRLHVPRLVASGTNEQDAVGLVLSNLCDGFGWESTDCGPPADTGEPHREWLLRKYILLQTYSMTPDLDISFVMVFDSGTEYVYGELDVNRRRGCHFGFKFGKDKQLVEDDCFADITDREEIKKLDRHITYEMTLKAELSRALYSVVM